MNPFSKKSLLSIFFSFVFVYFNPSIGEHLYLVSLNHFTHKLSFVSFKMMLSKLVLFAFIAYSMAIQITNPTTFEQWKTGEDHTITWNFVNTDKDIVGIYLSNYFRYPPFTKFLATVSVSDGSYTTDTTNWPTGGGYRINIGNPKHDEEIYAQSEEFILTAPGA
ncbi:developmentally Regulated MAPK Interacting protein [Schizosaccharomyces cryophilus OY26]|uniref:Developmentally Regulated MAPK Interacting protein n=1 Tax=Schizosaccharomyces cryophilus (strain OY26 / ATCC MYA-4695 / CBS 11777 / NBRC 106824 / NRRL Y48691) TaxID=653667 RepID=S9W3E2_SCHCR|nr:developmentally Regulated MAPK Interacting protein [Schizosaccharomyces cryophilus OY26]EPY53069.1 developmentally Regulated MAPK Interacting protein [Schizosaccharomyces cryophilus OY26]